VPIPVFRTTALCSGNLWPNRTARSPSGPGSAPRPQLSWKHQRDLASRTLGWAANRNCQAGCGQAAEAGSPSDGSSMLLNASNVRRKAWKAVVSALRTACWNKFQENLGLWPKYPGSNGLMAKYDADMGTRDFRSYRHAVILCGSMKEYQIPT
jgi:hypothetical protein